MQINKVKNAFKIADVELIEGTSKLRFVYLKDLRDENNNPLPESILKENVMRVYLIVVNGEIKKIGGSQDKGGIKKTLSIYQTGGIGGRPSIRSYGIWYFLFHQITDKKAKVEFYMIYQDNFPAKVKGLFDFHYIKNASLNYKLMEECCKLDYKKHENGNFPLLNMQESGSDWPQEVKIAHAKITNDSTKNITKKGRKIGLIK